MGLTADLERFSCRSGGAQLINRARTVLLSELSGRRAESSISAASMAFDVGKPAFQSSIEWFGL